MIEFKKLELEDKARIQQYTMKSSRRNCDLTFANLYSWRFLYNTEIAEYGDCLLFRFDTDNMPAYMLPVGNGDLKEVIEGIMEDASMHGFPFRMFGVCADAVSQIEEVFPNRFSFEAERDYADYLYLHTDLATLKGKKYQPKRNHINKFKNLYPDYEFKPLTREIIPDCIRLEMEWCKANNCKENEALQDERRSINAALEKFQELDIIGGVLMIKGQIAGFTYGAPLNHETFDTCVEKADTAYEGAYAVLNNEFAKMIPEQFVYINREEDLGLEGLRKAKLSYNPHIILDKFKMQLK